MIVNTACTKGAMLEASRWDFFRVGPCGSRSLESTGRSRFARGIVLSALPIKKWKSLQKVVERYVGCWG